MKDNIPNNATLIRYCYGKAKGHYFVWPTSRGRYEWWAAGNGGEEINFTTATEAARKWIIDTFNSNNKGDR